MQKHERVLLLVFVGGLGSAAGCTVGDGRPGDLPDASFPDGESCWGQVTGQVRFPNGVMTVPNALVYLTGPGREVARTGECGQCLGAEGVAASTTTGVGSRVRWSPATRAITSTLWRPWSRKSGSLMDSSREVVQERYRPPSTR